MSVPTDVTRAATESGQRRHRRGGLPIAVVCLLLSLLTGCTVGYTETPVPQAPMPQETPPPTGADDSCADALASYAPTGDLPEPGRMPDDSTMATISQRGRLIVGVSSDSRLLGARNRESGDIEGFDTDLARAVAAAIFGDPDRIELRVITAQQRIPLLADDEVDLVIRNFTMNCERWEDIAFSAEYYRSGTKILAARGAPISGLADLAEQRVCVPSGTTQAALLVAEQPAAVPVYAANHTQCLRLFQSAEADAIIGDDAVLAGLVSQDPTAEVMDTAALTAEPYGVGVNRAHVDLVRFVNQVIAERAADGSWDDSYDRWLAEYLGESSPPTPQYGRSS